MSTMRRPHRWFPSRLSSCRAQSACAASGDPHSAANTGSNTEQSSSPAAATTTPREAPGSMSSRPPPTPLSPPDMQMSSPSQVHAHPQAQSLVPPQNSGLPERVSPARARAMTGAWRRGSNPYSRTPATNGVCNYVGEGVDTYQPRVSVKVQQSPARHPSPYALPMACSYGVPNTGHGKQYVPDFAPKRRRFKALVIGIGYRGSNRINPLPGCVNDVKAIYHFITTHPCVAFHPDSVRVLCDEDCFAGVTIQGQQGSAVRYTPTRQNILASIKWLTDGAQDGDSLFFFFAGHGTVVPDVSGDEQDTGNDQCIVPVDLMEIKDDLLYRELVRRVPQGARLTALVDACQSGTVLDLPLLHERRLGPRALSAPAGTPPRLLDKHYLSAGETVLFSSSADDELSKEGIAPDQSRYGVMTKSFIISASHIFSLQQQGFRGQPTSFGALLECTRRLIDSDVSGITPNMTPEQLALRKQKAQFSYSHRFNVMETEFSL